MKFLLKTESLSNNLKIDHSKQVVLLGSCFSDELQPFFKNAGFKVLSNPFGTLFHPFAIADVIDKSISGNTEVDVVERDGLFFSWGASGVICEDSEEKLKGCILERRSELRDVLGGNTVLFITLGTAWGYRNKKLNKIVGNCHKIDQSQFDKELSAIDDMVVHYNEVLANLKKFNPDIEIVMTVSPVRHKRDGLIQNNRSKSRLIEFVHSLKGEGIHYFPSYEIVVDELRDYRFFKEDLVHPNAMAIKYIWEQLKSRLMTEGTQDLIHEVCRVNSMFDHKAMHPSSEGHLNMLKEANERKQRLSDQEPHIHWKKNRGR